MDHDIQYVELDEGLPLSFESRAMDVFQFQYRNNPIYRSFAESLGIDPASVQSLKQIPFLPISFFKTHSVQTGDFDPAIVFESSGTTGMETSKHRVKDLSLYGESFGKGFELFYGPVDRFCVIGLLPSYLERTGSSLVFMVDDLIKRSNNPLSGFYLNEYERLAGVLQELERRGQPVLLIGVSFALLDFLEAHPVKLKNTIVMETGGMKGRRKEITRAELHDIITQGFGIDTVHAEYGMTELLSQAYSAGAGKYYPVPWLRMLVREEDDPLTVRPQGEGLLNIIDLANIYSCAFIATDDIGRVEADGSFEVMGRRDNSDARGCSLLVV